VVEKDVENNRVVVGGENDLRLFSKTLFLSQWQWLRTDRNFPWKGRAKIRYRQSDQDVMVEILKNGIIRATFEQPQRAVAPGQFFVAYEGEELVGSGIIVE
jgi:tRNA-specific 2-thiouridylase